MYMVLCENNFGLLHRKYFHSKWDGKLILMRIDEVNNFKVMHWHRLTLDPENLGVLFGT